MKLVIAPDSFKGTLSAYEAANTIAEAFSAPFSTTLMPIADGGEGTLAAFRAALGGEYVTASVSNPYLEPIDAKFLLIGDIAVVEIAEAAGLTLVEGRKNAKLTSSYGVGELIRAALDAGAKKIYLAVGGSATNDGGAGMIAALGARFTDAEGLPMLPTGGTLEDIGSIDISCMDFRLRDAEFTALTDVDIKLLGDSGATKIFAHQKGATADDIETLERGMAKYAASVQNVTGTDISDIPGGGAAGGIGAAAAAFLNATISPGAEAVLKAMGFSAAIKDADAVITGEGRLDRQSFMGKAVGAVARAAKTAGVRTYCLAGSISDDVTDDTLRENGIELALKCASSDDWQEIKRSAAADLYRAAAALKSILE